MHILVYYILYNIYAKTDATTESAIIMLQYHNIIVTTDVYRRIVMFGPKNYDVRFYCA